jgi:hypothetical protein
MAVQLASALKAVRCRDSKVNFSVSSVAAVSVAKILLTLLSICGKVEKQ